ncbi:tyrosine-type recombinase/integrase [Undibacterium sp. Xuan67W]
MASDDKTFSVIGRRYMRDVLPTLGLHTQRDYAQYFELLNKVFGEMPIDVIRPFDIAEYLRVRGAASKVRANREKALFSTIFNHARSWGYTDVTNPCIGIKGHKEKSRDRYVSDDEYAAVWACAHPTVQDAMDLALCTGQRPADVLKFNVNDIFDGSLNLTQNKTGKKLRIAIEGELAQVITRIMAKPRDKVNKALLQDPDGRRLNYFALRSRFDKARDLAGINFQFRDLRAKAATDTGDLAHAQKLLGHKNRTTTEIYTRDRLGDLVSPLRRVKKVAQ